MLGILCEPHLRGVKVKASSKQSGSQGIRKAKCVLRCIAWHAIGIRAGGQETVMMPVQDTVLPSDCSHLASYFRLPIRDGAMKVQMRHIRCL